MIILSSIQSWKKRLPYKQCGYHQQDGQVDCHCCFKVNGFEEGCGIRQKEQEKRGKIGGQKFIDNSSLESYFQFQTLKYYFLKRFYIIIELNVFNRTCHLDLGFLKM